MNTKPCLITARILLFLVAIFGSVFWFGVAFNGLPNADNLAKCGDFGSFTGFVVSPIRTSSLSSVRDSLGKTS
jgi:hypothetical protein